MAKNKLDLTGLENLVALAEKDETIANGQPLDLPIDDVIEDPEQPRKFFTEASIESLAAQICASKSKKIRSPISVKPKNADGKYIINHGARRYRSTIKAGMKTIPAFIDETHDDYDQVAENVQREDLTPLEIAMFIQKRITKGDKKGDIAEKLGQKASFISEHLPLVDAPEFIQVLARDKNVGVRTLYDLIKAYAEFPVEVEAYAVSTKEITRASVAILIQNLKASNVVVIQQETDSGLNKPETVLEHDDNQQKIPVITEGSVEELVSNDKAIELNKLTTTKIQVEKLAILVKNGERIATIVHNQKVEITYKDTGEVAKIDLAAVKIIGTEVIH